MPKNKFNKDAYLAMLNQKLTVGSGNTEGRPTDLKGIAQRFRHTIRREPPK